MAVIYCRTACGSHNDLAILAQEAQCRTYAATRGFDISGVFYDSGKSGNNANRHGLREMMQFLQGASAHCILVRDESRLARDFHLCHVLQAACKQLGHVVVAVDDAADYAYKEPDALKNSPRSSLTKSP
ncbi:MAG: recombinase family protein [Pseudomonadota bacterium]|nr:recombinase family protein [Pseudomonadota bacterium]